MRGSTLPGLFPSSPLGLRCRRGSALLVAIVAALALGAPSGARSRPPVTRLGTGADEVWVEWPAGAPTSIVVFGHGWSTPFPVGFGPWLAHLRSRGSIVVYPRYRVGAGDSTQSALLAFETGIRTAFHWIGPQRLPVVAVGKSFGGSAVFDYATAARSLGVPAPTVILSIFPALPLGSLPPLPASTYVEFFVGDADTTAGSGGADAFWRWLASRPSDLKRYVVIRSRPGFVANHDSAQRSDPLARAIFWAPLDGLIARAQNGTRVKAPAVVRR